MNTQYFTETITALNSVDTYLTKTQSYVATVLADENVSCAELAELAITIGIKLAESSTWVTTLATKASSDTSAMQTHIAAAAAVLAPLLIAPTDLPSVLTWIENVILMYAGPYASLIAQEATVAAQAGIIAAQVTTTAALVARITSEVTTAIQNAQTGKGCL